MVCDKEDKKKIQNSAARLVTHDYNLTFSSSQAKTNLKWETLQNHRKKLRLKLLHHIFHSEIGIDWQQYLLEPHYVSTRANNFHKVHKMFSRRE